MTNRPPLTQTSLACPPTDLPENTTVTVSGGRGERHSYGTITFLGSDLDSDHPVPYVWTRTIGRLLCSWRWRTRYYPPSPYDRAVLAYGHTAGLARVDFA